MLIKKFEEIVNRYEENVALKIEGSSMTYGELNAAANRVAHFILQKRGQAGLLFRHGAGMVSALLGVLKAGMAYVPLDVSYPETRLQYILENSQSGVILTDNQNLDLANRLVEISNHSIQVVNIDAIDSIDSKIPADNPVRTATGDSIAYILYTSGSTGRPKGVFQTHENVWYYTRNWIRAFQIDSSVRMTLLTAFTHDGAVQDIFSALLTGATLYPYDIKNAVNRTSLADFLGNEKINIWHSVPTLFRYFADSIDGTLDGSVDFPHLRYILLGGEALRRHDIEIANRLFPNVPVANVYGQTESSVSTIHLIKPGESYDKPLLGEPLDETEILLVDEEDEIVEGLGVGEIVIACDHIAPGYWQDEETTEERFIHDPDLGRLYFTGDLGGSLAGGRIEMLGRKDFQVKVRGFRVELGEIETALLTHDAIVEASAVIKVPNDGEPMICAYMVTGQEVHIAELRRFLMDRLPDYMVPSHFILLDKMPLTGTGKIDRKALPDPGSEDMEEPYIPPQTGTEVKLVDIWAGVLRIDRKQIGVDSDFFQLGGHSLKAVTATLRIHRELGVRVELPQFFANPTVRRLAALIEKADKNAYVPVEAVEKREYYPLSPAQERVYIVQRMEGGGTAYNMPLAVKLHGQLNTNHLEHCFKQLIRRHESLRTSFTAINGVPVQRIADTAPFSIENLTNLYDLSDPYDQYDLLKLTKAFIRPFELAVAPLFRVGLVDGGDGSYMLLFDIHHIVSDGTSNVILMREFMALYQGVELPPLEVQYKDYARWQQGGFAKETLRKKEQFWRERFAGEIPVLQLPLDYNRPPVQSFEGSRIDFQLDGKQIAALKELASSLDVTLFMLLLALYNLFLSKLSGQEDIVVGTPTAGRGHNELLPVVGMFVNTLALRNRPCGELSFQSFLAELKENSLAAWEHQEYPFEDLVECLEVPRDAGRNPLFDVMFTLQNMDAREAEIPEVEIRGLRMSPVEFENPISKVDLLLAAAEGPSELFLSFQYCTKLFKTATIRRFINYFRQLTDNVVRQPGVFISEIEIIPPGEKQQVLEDFNRTEVSFPGEITLHGLFEAQVDNNPYSIAITAGNHAITYHQLDEMANVVAVELIQKGIGPGDIVALIIGRSIEMYTGIIGVLKTGAAYLPIDPGYPQHRIEYITKDSNASTTITPQHIPNHRSDAARRAQPPRPRAHEIGSGNLAYIIYTSGTTGKPKGTAITHRNVLRVIKNTNYIDITPGDRLLQLSNYAFDGSVFDIFGALCNGAELVSIREEELIDLRQLAALIRRERVGIFFVTTALFNALVDMDIACLSGVRKVLFGGEQVSLEHARRALEYLGPNRILHVYGPTETTVFATYYPIDTIEPDAVTVPIGYPLSDTQIYILDKRMNPQPIGVVGDLYIGGGGVAPGYLNNPQLTAQKFLAHSKFKIQNSKLYTSGDLARWLPGGEIQFAGRADQQVKIRGFRIELSEIENVLLTHPDIRETVLVVHRDETNGKYLCAYIVRTGLQPVPTDLSTQLKKHIARTLPDYMIPSIYIELDKIPLTPGGKIDRRALPKPGSRERASGYEPPTNATEERLIEIFRRILKLDQRAIGIRDDFFGLGGNSLNVVQLAASIHREFHQEIPVMELFRSPQVSQIALLINGKRDRQSLYLHFNPVNPANLVNPGSLFCFPPGIGYGAAYGAFAAQFKEVPVYAFHFVPSGDPVGDYVDEILRLQPRGPYLLLGASAGGEMALEVARRIEKQGHTVKAVILLDSFMGKRNPGKLDKENPFFQQYLLQVSHVIRELDAGYLEETVLDTVKSYRSYLDSLEHDIPVQAPVHLIAAADRPANTHQMWKSCTKGDYKVQKGFGTHFQMLEPGSIEENALLVRRLIDKF